MDLEYYEQVYYNYQVEGRGVQTPEKLRTQFQNMIGFYDENVGALLPADRSVACLDLGCGYGNWLYYLNSKGFINLSGADLDPRQVQLARLVGFPADTLDAYSAVAQRTQLGLVCAWDLIEHMDKSSAIRLLQLVHAALRPGGIVLLQMPCADGFSGAYDWCNDLTHRWSASSNMLRQLLRTVGFARVRIIDPSLPPFPRGIKRKLILANRRILRNGFSVFARALGIQPPAVWANSQIAIAWKADP